MEESRLSSVYKGLMDNGEDVYRANIEFIEKLADVYVHKCSFWVVFF